MRRLRWFLARTGEIGFGLGILLAAGWLVSPAPLGWPGIDFHPFWLVVLPAALQYGSGGGILAAVFASAVYLGAWWYREGVPPYWEDLLQWSYWRLPVFFTAVAAAAGGWTDVRRRRGREREEELEEELRQGERLRFQVRRLEEANGLLQNQIARRSSPLVLLYRGAKRMEGRDEEQLYDAALDLLTEHVDAKKCSLYLPRADRLVCRARRGWGSDLQTRGNLPLDGSVPGAALRGKRLVSLREEITWTEGKVVPGRDILLAVPAIGEEGEPIAVITVEEIPFLRLTESTENVLRMTADWLATAVERARRFHRLEREAILDEELGVYTETYFRHSLAREFERGRRKERDFSLFRVKIRSFPFLPEEKQGTVWKGTAQLLRKSLRGEDLVCRHPIRGFLWVLCPEQADPKTAGRRMEETAARYLSPPSAGEEVLEIRAVRGPGGKDSAEELLKELE